MVKNYYFRIGEIKKEQNGIRTHDFMFRKHKLYPLSYLLKLFQWISLKHNVCAEIVQ